MRKHILILVPLLLLYSNSFCQNGLEEIIKSELAFSDLCAKEGLYKSFTTYLVPDAIVFRPGIKKAKDVYTPERNTKALTWKPAFADISASGDFGYDTGPWKFQVDTTIAFGHFISVWEKQPDGNWRVIFDAGISHPAIKYDEWKIPGTTNDISKNAIKTTSENDAQKLRENETEISKLSSANGLSQALLQFCADDVRTYREGNLPAIGLAASKQLFSMDETKTESQTEYSKVSTAGDLGYTIGEGKIISENQNNKFVYMRMWKKIKDEWKIVLDLFSPYKE